MLIVSVFQKESTILMIEGCLIHFKIQIYLTTLFLFYSLTNLNLSKIFTTNFSPSFFLVHSFTFAQLPSPIVSPNTQLQFSGAEFLTLGSLMDGLGFFFSGVQLLTEFDLEKLSFFSQFIFIFEYCQLINITYSMSFILQKLSSSQQLVTAEEKIASNSQLFSFKNASLKNAKQLSEIQSKSILFKVICNFMHVFMLTCTFLLTKFEQTEQQEILQCLSTLFACFSAIIYIFVELNSLKLVKKINNQQKTSVSSVALKISTVLFYLVHPNYLSNNIYIEFNNLRYKLNQLLSIVVCMRIFSLIVFCIQFSRFYGLRVSRVADLYANKEKMSLKFAIKCLYKQKGLKMPLFMLFVGLIIICFIDVNFHRASNMSTNFLESLYDAVMTMTTVGFGDITHENDFQRMKSIFLAILGSFISSLLTLTILNYCEFSQEETKAYITFKRLGLKEGLGQSNKQFLKGIISSKRGQNRNILEQKGLKFAKKLKEYKAELSQYYWNDNLRSFYMKKNSKFHLGIKKIVQKQLIIKTLMNFFISRRTIIEEEIIIQNENENEVKTPKSVNSTKSKKRREDTKEMMVIWEKILQDQPHKKRVAKDN